MPIRPIRELIRNQRICTTSPGTTVRDAALLMTERGIGALPVVDNDVLVGIFSERDIMTRVVAAGRDPATTHLEAVMTRDPATSTPDKPVIHALHIMHEGDFRHLPILEHGRLVGIVSARDVQAIEMLSFERDLESREQIALSLGG